MGLFTLLGSTMSDSCIMENRKKWRLFAGALCDNRPFPSYFKHHYESVAKCKTFHVNISFVCI